MPLALADLDRAAALRPGEPEVLFDRAWANLKAKRWEAAGRDLLTGLRLRPTDEDGRQAFDPVLKGLVYDGWEHHRAGRREDALRVYDLAAELAPDDIEVRQRRAAIVTGNPRGDAGGEAQLEEAVRNKPDDWRAHQELDYALAKERKFDRVVAMWTEYLTRHPNDGPAYLERGGAYFNLRRAKDAHADASKACELAVSEGCLRAKQIAPMVK